MTQTEDKTFRGKVCWNSSRLSNSLALKALEPVPSYFLMTHSRIEGMQIEERGLLRPGTPDEEGLYEILTNPSVRHAFVIIRGAPGSGKSHLIRWLKYRITGLDDRDRVVLIDRSDGSLKNTLLRIVDQLKDQNDLLGHLRKASECLNEWGRASELHARICDYLDPKGVIDDYPHKADVLATNFVSLLRSDPVRDLLLTPKGAVGRITTRIMGASEQQWDEGRFEEFTLQDIKQICGVSNTNLASVAKGCLAKIAGNNALQARLLVAINARLQMAIQKLINFSSTELVDIFREIRCRIYPGRLFLLAEDIASFQGLDKQLVEALIDDQEGEQTDRPRARLIGVVGFTHGYYEREVRPHKNITDRVTLEVMLTDPERGDSGEAHVKTLDSPEARDTFVGHYLNACRLREEEVEEWFRNLTQARIGNRPNACDACDLKARCHGTFGTSSDGFGLYPLTSRAISNLYSVLRHPDTGASEQTPRGVIRDILVPVLTDGERLSRDQAFPTQHVAKYRLPASKHWQNEFANPYGTSHAKAFEVLMKVWGDGTIDGQLVEGKTMMGVVDLRIFEAFGFDMSRVHEHLEFPELNADDKIATETVLSEPKERGPSVDEEGGAGLLADENERLTQELHDIDAWFDTEEKPLESATQWRRFVHQALVDFVPWELYEISELERASVLTEASINIENSRIDPPTRNVLISRNEVTAGALKALAKWTRTGRGSWGYRNAHFDQQALYRFLRRHEHSVVNFVREGAKGAADWNQLECGLQLIAVDATMRGEIKPRADLVEALQAVVNSTFTEPTHADIKSAPEHSAKWNFLKLGLEELDQRIPAKDKTLRSTLARRFSLKSGKERVEFARAYTAIRPLRLLLEKMELESVPGPKEFTDITNLATNELNKLARKVSEGLVSALDDEIETLRARVEVFDRVEAGDSLSLFVTIMGRLYDAVRKYLAPSATDAAMQWQKAFQPIAPLDLSSVSIEQMTKDIRGVLRISNPFLRMTRAANVSSDPNVSNQLMALVAAVLAAGEQLYIEAHKVTGQKYYALGGATPNDVDEACNKTKELVRKFLEPLNEFLEASNEVR